MPASHGAIAFACLVTVLVWSAPLAAQADPKPGSDEELRELAVRYGERWTPEAAVHRKAGPAVVSVTSFDRGPDDQPFPRPRSVNGGTGIVVDPKGLVLTSAHVVVPDEFLDPKRITCRIHFADEFGGGEHAAEVVAVDREWDLALLRILDGGDFPALALDTPGEPPLVGEHVILIGAPYGNELSLSAGVLSGVDRTVRVDGVRTSHVHEGLLQTDAPVNPGNSGGPMLDVTGRLLGICNATIGSADGIGYAVPVERVREILEQRLLAPRLWLGFGVRPDSLEVVAIHPRGPAAGSGLALGDRVLRADGRELHDVTDFYELLLDRRPGEPLELEVFGRDGALRRVVLTPRPEEDRWTVGLLGMRVSPNAIVPAQVFGGPVSTFLRVDEVFPGSGAADLGIRPGDVLLAVRARGRGGEPGWMPLRTPDQLVALVRGPDFVRDDLNLWWIREDGRSLKGHLRLDDPAILPARDEAPSGARSETGPTGAAAASEGAAGTDS